jgi:hypothetical protein
MFGPFEPDRKPIHSNRQVVHLVGDLLQDVIGEVGGCIDAQASSRLVGPSAYRQGV